MIRFALRIACALVTALLLSAASGVGCGAGASGGCPALDHCGGDPTGKWKLARSCQYSPVRPAQPSDTYVYQTTKQMPVPPTLPPPQPLPVVLQQNSSGDWCSDLVFSKGMVANANLWHEVPTLRDAQVTFGTDHTYAVTLTFKTDGYDGGVNPDAGTGMSAGPGSNRTHFAPACLAANGGNPTCGDLATGLTAFYGQQLAVPPFFQNIQCSTAPDDGGCDCSYVFVVVISDQGSWSVVSDALFEDSNMANYSYNGLLLVTQNAPSVVPAQTMEATFCARSGQLTLTGANGSSLSGATGLRTLTLTPM